jgi:hypothetical protein
MHSSWPSFVIEAIVIYPPPCLAKCDANAVISVKFVDYECDGF